MPCQTCLSHCTVRAAPPERGVVASVLGLPAVDCTPPCASALACRYLRALARATVAALLLLIVFAGAARGDTLLRRGGGGELMLCGATGADFQSALMQHSTVHFAISGMLAQVTLEQTFRHTGDDWAEAVYSFPLPDRAAVRRLEVAIGERRIIGRVRERAAAAETYREAVVAGKKATLVEQQRPNLFTSRVANIAPGEVVRVTLEYVQPLEYVSGAFSLRFPMALTPRYIPGVPRQREHDTGHVARGPGSDAPSVASGSLPDAEAITPPQRPGAGVVGSPLVNPIEITATLDAGMPLASIESASHPITLSSSHGVYSVELPSGAVEMDRDFVLRWVPLVGAEPGVAAFGETVGEADYSLLMLMPPQPDIRSSQQPTGELPRELIFVIDTSGSMGGHSIRQARAALDLALRRLHPRDRFNIIAFDDTVTALHRAPVAASGHHVAMAREFVRHLDAGGGTEMSPALRRAMPSPAAPDTPARLRQIVFITDGAVGNEQALYRQIEQGLGDARLFTVGIGSAPNGWFMRKAAQFGRGTYTLIGNLDEVADKMTALFTRIGAPVVTDIQLQWPAGVSVEVWPQRVRDLYAGEPLVIAARITPGGVSPVQVTVTGHSGGRAWSSRVDLLPGATLGGHVGVASLWARRKIEALVDLERAGVPGEEVRRRVLPVALEHQLLSPYTSFVAVEERRSRPADEPWTARKVAGTLPIGMPVHAIGYPATATTGPARLYFGLLLLFLALMTHVLRQPEADHESRDRG